VVGGEFVEHVLADQFVDIEQRDGVAAFLFAAELEVGDVDAGVAQRRAHEADHAGHVGVGDVDHVLADFGIHVDALDLDEARLAVREHGARDRAGLALGGHGQLDVAVIDAGLVALDLGEHDALFLDHDRRGDHVDIGHLVADQAGKQRRRQRLGVHARGHPVIEDLDLLDRAFGDLAGKRAEHVGKPDEGFQDRRFFRRDRRHVDGVGDRAADQVVRHLFGHLQRHVFLRFRGGGAQMRGADDVVEAEQRALGGGLGLEHVEAGAGDMARLDRLGKGRLVDQAAAGAVDDAHAGLGLGQRLGIENAAGLVGHRHVQGDEVGACQQLVELDLGHAHFLGPLL
jgi:hypothetical protein